MKIEAFNAQATPGGFVARFAQAADQLRRDPYRAGALPTELTARFLQLPWPTPRNFFIASKGGRTLATLGANLSAASPELGFVGFQECEVDNDDATEAMQRLLIEAETFLKRNGAKQLLGPVNYSSWFPYRLLKPRSPPPYYSWEPTQPPEYHDHFLAAGYEPAASYLSVAQSRYEPLIEALAPAIEHAEAKGYRLRPFDGDRLLDREVPILHRITMESYTGNYLFEPLPLEAFRELYVPIARKMDFGLCFFLLDPSGSEVGYLFAFMDERFKDHCVLKTIGLLPRVRGGGLSNAVIGMACREAKQRGASRVIHALARSDAQSRSYARYAAIDWEHEYILMGKTLT